MLRGTVEDGVKIYKTFKALSLSWVKDLCYMPMFTVSLPKEGKKKQKNTNDKDNN